MTVELRKRKWKMIGDEANHYERLWLERIWCVSWCTIPNMIVLSTKPARISFNTSSSQPSKASMTSDCWYPLIPSTSWSYSSLIILCFIHYSTIIAEHNVTSSLSIPPCQDDEWTPNGAYTECSIHQGQHSLRAAYPEYSIYPRLFGFPSIPWLSVDHCRSL